jgi:hypothetical protein
MTNQALPYSKLTAQNAAHQSEGYNALGGLILPEGRTGVNKT